MTSAFSTRRNWLQRSASAAALYTGLGSAAALIGCSRSDINHDSADAPGTAPLPRVPRVAWVFSSGGPRCFVHVGVLKALEELGLKPDLVVGASGGALVGTLWASGCGAKELESLALELNPLSLGRLAVGASERFSGSALAELVREHSRQPALEKLPTMAVCVAQRLGPAAGLETKLHAARNTDVPASVVGFNVGDVGLAVQAACAIEGQFAPVFIRGQAYADADLVTPMPVRIARSLGAQRVLAVDASAHEDRAPETAQRWRAGDLRKRALTATDARVADLLLHPDFGYFVSMSREFRERCIAAGYSETIAAAQALRQLHTA